MPRSMPGRLLPQAVQPGLRATGSPYAACFSTLPAPPSLSLPHPPAFTSHTSPPPGLQSLGIGIEGVARLLQHCPALFSWPPQQRAEPLFAELMGERLGLGAAEAAEVLVCCPALANTKHVMPSIVRLVAHTRADSLSEA